MVPQCGAGYRASSPTATLFPMEIPDRFPFGPHWFAAVMGTGLLAVATESVGGPVPGRHTVSLLLWLAAVATLGLVVAAGVREWRRDPGLARRHLDDPELGHFYGAPAMALLVVGAGAMVTGHQLLGQHLAVALDAVLWSAGTAAGLVTAVLVPLHAMTSHEYAEDSAAGAWLLPVVPPVVSAATGALLVPHLPPGQAQQTLLLVCYAFVGVSVVAGLLVLCQLWQRLLRHGPGAHAAAPTLWIPLGFLGQSVTAVHHLGVLAPRVLPADGRALRAVAVVYGVPVWGFALLWLALVVGLTVRALRAGLPFTLSWWSFVFPLGTVVTASAALAEATGAWLFGTAATLLLGALSALWVIVALRTLAAMSVAPRPRFTSAG